MLSVDVSDRPLYWPVWGITPRAAIKANYPFEFHRRSV